MRCSSCVARGTAAAERCVEVRSLGWAERACVCVHDCANLNGADRHQPLTLFALSTARLPHDLSRSYFAAFALVQASKRGGAGLQ